MNPRQVVFGTLAGAALLLLLGRWGAELYTDHLWFASMGASAVWRARLETSALLGGGSFVVATLFAFLNLYAVRQSVVSLVLPRRLGNIEIGEEVPPRVLLLAVCLLSALIGVAVSLPTELWTTALLAWIGQPFVEADPYFGADLGFFVYWLPFETAVHYWAVLVLLVVTLVVVALYALTPSLRWERGSLFVSAYVRRHFTMLGGVLLLVLAWSYRLAMYHLLVSGGDGTGVFSAIDHRVMVPATLLLSVVTLSAGIVVGWAGWTGQMRLAFLAVSTVLVLSLVARTVAPLVTRRSVDPAAAAAEARPYRATRLGYTRRAYGVDRMRPESLGAGFASLAEAVPRTAVWDGVTLARAAERMRRVRVVGGGAGWQQTDSGLSALLVERGSDPAAESRDAWGIRRLDPTSADELGMPRRTGGASRFGDETLLDEPAVYDSAPAYSVLADSLQRIAGVEMVSTTSRLAHAWSLQNFRLLFGDLPRNRPTIVQRRDVRERLASLAPFFVQASQVVPVMADDSLYWVVEMYAASSSYPLAQRFSVLGEERSYFQHAASAVLHASSGQVRLVLAASPDPVSSTWANRFPGLFVSVGALSVALQAALPPVTDGARAQALAFAATGFRGDSLEVRHFAAPDGADSAASHEPLHVRLPGAGIMELLPLLDSTDRVRGMVAASAGASRVTSWIPVASDGLSFNVVVDRMRATETAVRGSGLTRGPLRVIPVGGTPVYVQSVFQGRPGGAPSLVRVVVLRGDSVRAAATLATASGLSRSRRPQSAVGADLRAHAESLYKVMKEALTRSDWATFGRTFDDLGSVLRVTIP